MPNSDDNDDLSAYGETEWARVGAAIRERMAQLRLKQKDVERRSGMSNMTIRPIQQGKPGNRRPATLSSIALALEWPYNAIRRILDGEDPGGLEKVVWPNQPQPMPPAPQSARTYDERINALPRREREKIEQVIEMFLDLAEGEMDSGENNRAGTAGPMMAR